MTHHKHNPVAVRSVLFYSAQFCSAVFYLF
jgi:hypothetical protein